MNHVTDRLLAHLAGELTPDEARAVSEHLATCAACAREAEQLRAVWDELGAAEPAVAGDADAWPAVRARTFGAAGPQGVWRRTAAGAAALAAGFALAVLLPAGAETEALAEEPAGAGFWFSAVQTTSLGEFWLVESDGEETP